MNKMKLKLNDIKVININFNNCCSKNIYVIIRSPSLSI